MLLPRQLIVVNQIKLVGRALLGRREPTVNSEQYCVVALGAYYPNGHAWRLHVLTNLEISEVLEESEEADVCLLADALEDEALSQVTVAVMDIGLGLTRKH